MQSYICYALSTDFSDRFVATIYCLKGSQRSRLRKKLEEEIEAGAIPSTDDMIEVELL